MTPLRGRSRLETIQGRSDELGFLWILATPFSEASPPPQGKQTNLANIYTYYIYVCTNVLWRYCFWSRSRVECLPPGHKSPSVSHERCVLLWRHLAMTLLYTENNFARHKQHLAKYWVDRVSALGLSLGVPRKLKSNESSRSEHSFFFECTTGAMELDPHEPPFDYIRPRIYSECLFTRTWWYFSYTHILEAFSFDLLKRVVSQCCTVTFSNTAFCLLPNDVACILVGQWT